MTENTPENLEAEIYKIARDMALKRLDRKECSTGDIYSHLLKKGARKETATQVVADLVKAGLISDERYAKMMTREQVSRGKGMNFIRQKLKMKGIDLNLEKIKEIREEVAPCSELDKAKEILRRRYPKAHTDRKESNRAYQALVRRGFSFALAQQALKEIAADPDLISDSNSDPNSE